MKRRFLLLTQFFPPETGAAPTRLAALVKRLLHHGHEVEILTALPNYPDGKIFSSYREKFYVREEWQGCTVHRFWLIAGEGKAWRRLLNYLSFAVTACFGFFVCRRPDVIFVNSGPLFVSIPAQVLCALWGCPYIFNVADLWPRSVEHLQGLSGKIFLKLALSLESLSYRRAGQVTAVTMGIREVLLKEKNVPSEKVLFLPNGVDTELFSPRLESSGLRQYLKLEGKKVLIYPGNHGYGHGLEKALEAAHLLQADHPEVHFVFIGGGSDKSRLKGLAEQMQLSNVSFLDPVLPEKLVDYIQLADVGLIHVRNSPLAEETRPAKMFPLMAMAKPILYCGFGEGAEILRQNGGGVVVPPEEPALLKEALLKMLEQPEKLKEMGQNNRSFVRANFDVSKLIDDWLNLLRV